MPIYRNYSKITNRQCFACDICVQANTPKLFFNKIEARSIILTTIHRSTEGRHTFWPMRSTGTRTGRSAQLAYAALRCDAKGDASLNWRTHTRKAQTGTSGGTFRLNGKGGFGNSLERGSSTRPRGSASSSRATSVALTSSPRLGKFCSWGAWRLLCSFI